MLLVRPFYPTVIKDTTQERGLKILFDSMEAKQFEDNRKTLAGRYIAASAVWVNVLGWGSGE